MVRARAMGKRGKMDIAKALAEMDAEDVAVETAAKAAADAAAAPTAAKNGGGEQAAALPLNFGKRLAHTDKAVRDRGFKVLKLWLKKHPDLERLDYLKLWKGLYFGMWMSDKRPVQQELSVNMALLINDVAPGKQTLWMETFWATMEEAWEKLDKHRMNKYMLFMRIVIAEYFKVIRVGGWRREDLRQAARIFTRSTSAAADGQNVHSIGLVLQLIRLFWDELTPQLEASGSKVDPDVLIELLGPFLELTERSHNETVVRHIHEHMLRRAPGEGLRVAIASRALAGRTRALPKNREALRTTAAALGAEDHEDEDADAEAASPAPALAKGKKKRRKVDVGKQVSGALDEGDSGVELDDSDGEAMPDLMLPEAALGAGKKRGAGAKAPRAAGGPKRQQPVAKRKRASDDGLTVKQRKKRRAKEIKSNRTAKFRRGGT